MTTAGPLTVKHIEEGHESICQALSVEYEEVISASPGAPSGPQVNAYGVPNGLDGTINRYGSGVVYVMNEAGATVGRYDLDREASRLAKAA